MRQDYAEQSARLGVAHFFERAYVGVADKRARVREILTNNCLAATETASIGDTVDDVETRPRWRRDVDCDPHRC